MGYAYLGDDENIADLEARIKGHDREVYKAFGHLRVEPCFDSRLFIVYKPQGLTSDGLHKQPQVLTTLKVIDFYADAGTGSEVIIADLTTGQQMTLNHIPQRVFGYDLFMSVPPILRLRWGARIIDGETVRSLAYALLVKTKNRSDFHSFGVTYAETPNCFRDRYPSVELNLHYI